MVDTVWGSGAGSSSTTIVANNSEPPYSAIKAGIIAARLSDPTLNVPWGRAPVWTNGERVFSVDVRRNAAGTNLYRVIGTPAGLEINSDGTAVTCDVEPSGTGSAPIGSGTANTPVWLYEGPDQYTLNVGPKASSLANLGIDGFGWAQNSDPFASLGLSRSVPSSELSFLGGVQTGPGTGLTGTDFPGSGIGTERNMVGHNNYGTAAAPGYAESGVKPVIRFRTNSPKFGFFVLGPGYQGRYSHVATVHNGDQNRLLSVAPFTIPATLSPGAWFAYDLSKIPGTSWEVTLIFRQKFPGWIIPGWGTGLMVPPNTTVSPSVNPAGFGIVVEGCSIEEGGGPSVTAPFFNIDLARLIGAKIGAANWFNDAVGSTGFIANGPSGIRTTYAERIVQIKRFCDQQPNGGIVFYLDPHNDQLSTQSAQLAAYQAALTTLRQQIGPKWLIVTGAASVLATESLTGATKSAEDNLYTAFTTWNDPHSLFLRNLSAANPWLNSSSGTARHFLVNTWPLTSGSMPQTDAHPTGSYFSVIAEQCVEAVAAFVAGR